MMDDVLRALWIRNSQLFQASADDATATATATAKTKLRFFVHKIYADYDAAVAAIKTVTLVYTFEGAVVTDVYHPDFTNDEFVMGMMIHGDSGTAVTLALEASGTGGIDGFVKLSGFYG